VLYLDRVPQFLADSAGPCDHGGIIVTIFKSLSRHSIAHCIAITAISITFIGLNAPRANAQNGGNGLFLPTYLGPTTANDLLVNSSTVVYDGTNFVFTSFLGAPVGTTSGGFYVWGVNRGAGTAGFAALGQNNVLFDAIILARPVPDSISPTPSLVVNRLGGGGSTTLPLANMTFFGNQLTLVIPASTLPSRGFLPNDYQVNLWPRFQGVFNGNNVTGNAQISQFAPNNATFQVSTAPEPGSFALLAITGLPLVGAVVRRRFRRTGAAAS
jgi:hypothetical protein